MTEKKDFWGRVPGMVTGIASIVTGLAVRPPVLIDINHGKKEADRSASPANPTATSTLTPSPSTSGSDTSTATPDSGLATDSATPGPGESGSPGATPGPSLAAAPPTVDFGHVTLS